MKKLFLAGALLLPVLAVRAGDNDLDTLRVHHIDQVTVTSLRSGILRSDVPNLVEIATRRDITRSAATSLSEMIYSFTPAEAASMQGLTGGVELRGFAPDAVGDNRYTLLLVDGIRMGTYTAGATTLGGIQSIEVVRGPFSSLYGSGAMGGVINILTPQSTGALHGSVSRTWATFNTSALSAWAGGSISPVLDFDLSFDFFDQGGDYRTGGHNILKMNDADKQGLVPAYARDTTYHNTAYDQTHALLRLGWDICHGWRLSVSNDIYYTGHALANGTMWGFYEKSSKNLRRELYRADLTGGWRIHSIRVTPYVATQNYDLEDRGMSAQSHYRLGTYGITAQDAMDFGFGKLLVGADHLTEKHASTQKDLWDLTPQTPFLPDYDNRQTGVFAQFNFSLFDGHLSGIAGVRYDNIRFKTVATDLLAAQDEANSNYNTVNPNFSLQWRFLDRFRLHAGVGRAFLAPEAFKVAGNYTIKGEFMGFPWQTDYHSNPDLKPETSVTWEAGVGYASENGALEADVSLFFTDHDNLIVDESQYDAATDITNIHYYNANQATIRGLELAASFDLGRALEKEWSWRFKASCTRIFHSEVKTPTVTREREYLSRTKIVFGTDFSSGRFSASFCGRYIGSKTEKDLLSYSMPDYMRVPTANGLITNPAHLIFDATASCRLWKGLAIGVKAANLLDELYMERDGYYMPGRSFSASLSFVF